ncbi:Streptothricin hydrolase [compost metagenome]
MAKRALIVVDLQQEYQSQGKLPLAGINEAVANARRLLDAARARDELIIHIRHETPGGSGDVPFAPGTFAVEIIGEVAPMESETVLTKHYPNSFRDTELKAHLDRAEVTEVVIVGAMSNMCIDATARAAFDFGYEVTVVHDACAAMGLSFDGRDVPAEQVHAAFMAALAFAYGRVIPTSDLLEGSTK